MAGKLNQHAYERLVAEDIAWLEKQPRTLEREHVIGIVRESVAFYYPADELTDGRIDRGRAERIIAKLNAAAESLRARIQRMAHPEAPRAGGDVTCERCGLPYRDHPSDPVESFLTVLCDGSLVKL
jgi:predicted chitinase